MRKSRLGASAAAAIAELQPSDVVIVGHLEPRLLLEEICRQAERLAGLTLIVWPFTVDPPYLRPEVAGHFRILTLAGTHGFGKRIAAGTAEYLPIHMSQITQRRMGDAQPTAVLLHLSAREADGRYSCGYMADYVHSYAHPTTRLVLGEANAAMPASSGPNRFGPEDLDFVVGADEEIVYAGHADDGELPHETALAAHVASIMPDRATFEIGSTRLANAIVRALRGRRGLGFHSGVLSPAVLELMDAGVITNEHKPINTGVSVTATLHGDPAQLRTAATRRDIEVWPNSYTHDVKVIAQIPGFVAINSALQVDLYGQVYSEVVGGRVLGAAGGQADFMRGAARAPGGFSVIALAATTTDGRRSRIVAGPGPGDVVSGPATDVDFVVTEHGVAALRGKTLRQRMEALCAVAAPQFRETLQESIAQRL